MQWLGIVGVSILAAILYGICHDQVTARVCVEYFTIGHPKVIESESPTLLALTWGVLATWWVGLPLGILLGCAARIGGRSKRSVRDVLPGIGVLLAVMAFASFVAGVFGYTMARLGHVHLTGRWAEQVPAERHVLFLADLWAHNAAYLFGGLGGLVLVVWTIVGRIRSARAADDPS